MSLALAGCGLLPIACTDAGCESGVRFSLDQDLVAETEYRVVACVDDECAEGVLEVPPPDDGPFTGVSDGPISLFVDTDSVFYSLDQLQLPGAHHVSLTVHGPGDELLAEWEGTPEFERTLPNGPNCEPTCWLAEVLV